MALYEVPVFASRCEIMTGGGVYNWSTWAIRRRLRHDAGAGAYRSKYSVHGRMLKHIPVTTPYATLPANPFTFEKNALVLYANAGLNGQLRVVEAGAACADCYGAVYAYQPTTAGTPGTVYVDVSWRDAAGVLSSTTGARQAAAWYATTQVAPAYKGRQRGVFGSYLVVNKDAGVMEFWGYDSLTGTPAGSTWKLIFTTTAVAELALLGSHEYYYWPGRSMLLARLGDGASFRFWRFAADFQTIAGTAGEGALVEKKITQTDLALLQVNGRVAVPPVFWGDYAAFYCTDENQATQVRAGYIRIYKYSTQMY